MGAITPAFMFCLLYAYANASLTDLECESEYEFLHHFLDEHETSNNEKLLK